MDMGVFPLHFGKGTNIFIARTAIQKILEKAMTRIAGFGPPDPPMGPAKAEAVGPQSLGQVLWRTIVPNNDVQFGNISRRLEKTGVGFFQDFILDPPSNFLELVFVPRPSHEKGFHPPTIMDQKGQTPPMIDGPAL